LQHSKIIFKKKKFGNECKEGKNKMGAHTFKEGSSKFTSGRELMTAHFMQI
jgi:hypothetical protein